MTDTPPISPTPGAPRRSFLLRTAGLLAAAAATPVLFLKTALGRRPHPASSRVRIRPHEGSVPRTTRKSDPHG